jgi:thioredoxin reductase
MTLGRSLRDVLIIDNGRPCNRQTPHSHNFLTRDGATPAFLAAVAKEQVLAYPTVQWLDETVSRVEELEDGLRVFTAGGLEFNTAKLLLATGVIDEMLPIPGLLNAGAFQYCIVLIAMDMKCVRRHWRC